MCSLGHPPLPRSWSQSRTAVCVCFPDTASYSLALASVTLARYAALATPPCLGLGLNHALRCVCASLTQRATRSPWYQSHSPGVQPRPPPPCLVPGFSHALHCVCILDTASSALALVSATLAWCAASATPPCLGLGPNHALLCVPASLTQRATRSPWYQSHSPGVQPWPPPCLGLGLNHALRCVCASLTQRAPTRLGISHTRLVCSLGQRPCLGLGFRHALIVCASLTLGAPRSPGISHTRPVTHPSPSSLSPFGHVTDCPSGTSLD